MTMPNDQTSHGLWQPIETAPRDGTRLLLWCEGECEMGWWSGTNWDSLESYLEYGFEACDTCIVNYSLVPSHWQPLPPPPQDYEPGCVR